jgi:cyclopropane-fatty-acyl-phospholipid synthase
MSILKRAAHAGISTAERGVIPDAVLRFAIRRLCEQRLRGCGFRSSSGDDQSFLTELFSGPIALVPERANQQHYELPPEFFGLVLGPHRKYSCCRFVTGEESLAQAEAAALESTCNHAQLADGQTILELGCGWGSLSLWMAEKYPRSLITSVSNSAAQRGWIQSQADQRDLKNLHVVTADINDFSAEPMQFDRVVSVEMFEHVRNYDLLLARIQQWLKREGRLLVHHFCHRHFLYPFEEAGSTDWMARHFFSGGLMPSSDLLHRFPERFTAEAQWIWNGSDYRRTADAWLHNLDARRAEALAVLRSQYGAQDASRWLQRWRMFFLAVSELFGFRGGNEWFVTHCRLKPVR